MVDGPCMPYAMLGYSVRTDRLCLLAPTGTAGMEIDKNHDPG
jgi:hypothetical protein